ncbi:MAG TPA: hypothetical protein PKC32_10390 [Sphingopyxis sp.]|jgi:hypothetical protein|nr:hypothetical protein [Sphingopyxis sp.]
MILSLPSKTAEVQIASFLIRHAELVSASMARLCGMRRALFQGRPWTLKQVRDYPFPTYMFSNESLGEPIGKKAMSAVS